MNSFKVPVVITKIAKTFQSRGFQVWVVGGALRSFLLGLEIKDWDLATTASPDEMLAIFPEGNPVGEAYGCVFLATPIGAVQVTTLREESVYQDHRRPHHVVFTDRIELDLRRRDFTCNAMAYQVLDQMWIDPFDGRVDIVNKKLRAVGDPQQRLHEDALRVLRAIRFVSELGFAVETDLLQALQETRVNIAYLSVERIYAEWERILCGQEVQKALNLLEKIGAGEILPMKPSPGLDIVRLVPKVFWLRMVALYADHMKQLVALPKKTWLDFGMSKRVWKKMSSLAFLLDKDGVLTEEIKYLWLQFFLTIDEKKALLRLLSKLQKQNIIDYLEQFCQLHPNFDFHTLPVTTQDIAALTGVVMGPEIGEILRALHVWIASHPEKLSRDGIENWLKSRYTLQE